MHIDHILKMSESGYFKSVLSFLMNDNRFNQFIWWIYFKRATDEPIRWQDIPDGQQIVLIILGDESEYIPQDVPKNILCIFKNYLRKEEPGIYHLAVGPNQNIQEMPYKALRDRKYNIFFSGNLHRGRFELYQFLTGIKWLPFFMQHRLRWLLGNDFSVRYKPSIIQFTKKFQSGLGFTEYAETIADSRIVLCPAGNPGIETMRHYEALRAGAIVITTKLPDVWCFQDAPVVILQNWNRLHHTLEQLLDDEVLMQDISEKSLNWWQERGSAKAASVYIWQTISQNVNKFEKG